MEPVPRDTSEERERVDDDHRVDRLQRKNAQGSRLRRDIQLRPWVCCHSERNAPVHYLTAEERSSNCSLQ